MSNRFIRIANIAFIWRNISLVCTGIALITLSWVSIQAWSSSNPVTRTNNSVAVAEAQPLPEVTAQELLDNELYNFKQTNPDSSIVVKSLNGDFNSKYNEEEVFKSASLYKAFLAYRAYELIGQKLLNPDMIVLNGLSLSQCIDKMITISDNDCGIYLQKFLNSYSTTELYRSRGFHDTNLSGYYPTTSARDVAKLFEDIHNGVSLTLSAKNKLISLFSAQQINDRIPMYLPKDVTVAHKTGDIESYIHDAGIVYSPQGNYVIVILTSDWDVNLYQAYDKIGVVSETIYSLTN